MAPDEGAWAFDGGGMSASAGRGGGAFFGFAALGKGTETAEPEGFVVKISGRIDRKVDGDKLQALAAEAGLSDHLATLFRWKPEINMDVWRSTDESITKPLADAITAKPGRASFKIITKE